MKNIVLFGGSFNPPTIAHQIVIKQTWEILKGNLDEIWLLPDYQHSFAKNEELAPPQNRLEMTRMLTSMKVRVETCCLDQKMSGNTIEHIRFLQEKHPHQKFSFLMGSDNLKTFKLWPEWQLLLNLMAFYVYPRAGYPLEPLFQNMMALSHPLQVITNISSRLVRERIKTNLSWEQLVPEPIAKYIIAKQLFL